MEVMTIDTLEESVRSGAVGWSIDDASMYIKDKPIGLTPSPNCPFYPCILAALHDNWRLLGVPQENQEDDFSRRTFTWWLTR